MTICVIKDLCKLFTRKVTLQLRTATVCHVAPRNIMKFPCLDKSNDKRLSTLLLILPRLSYLGISGGTVNPYSSNAYNPYNLTVQTHNRGHYSKRPTQWPPRRSCAGGEGV